MGDDLTFDNLEITFLVDEKLANYIELHNWLVGIGFPSQEDSLQISSQIIQMHFQLIQQDKGAPSESVLEHVLVMQH